MLAACNKIVWPQEAMSGPTKSPDMHSDTVTGVPPGVNAVVCAPEQLAPSEKNMLVTAALAGEANPNAAKNNTAAIRKILVRFSLCLLTS